jgi:hypothetical protein
LRRQVPPPKDPALAAFVDRFAVEYATARGWGHGTTGRIRQSLRIMLGLQQTPGAMIKASDADILRGMRRPIKPALEILAAAGMLDDDRVPALDTWFPTKLADLPPEMAGEIGVWFEVMRHGSTSPPRMRPRSPTTIRVLLCAALPGPAHLGQPQATAPCARSPAPTCSP